MLGHSSLDVETCHRRTLIDNVSLVTPALMGKISRLAVDLGHEVARRKPGAGLSGRVDWLVVETDVEPPTDVRLLRDAWKTGLACIRRSCRLRFPGSWKIVWPWV